ncbi:MAG: hypothetical protein HGA27_04925, partial [Peptococcaceae bacterium]|nr:hypothetical protein [Peptococcaceae bacterium]
MSSYKLRNIGKQILCLVLSISLLSNSLFSLIEPAEAAAVIPISDLQAGDTINFGGYKWLVLDPNTGYLYKYDLYGDSIPYIGDGGGPNSPDNSNSIYYYLNDSDVFGGFYSSLSATDQGLIQNHAWTTGVDGNESASSISCKVGLISYSEVETYQSIIADLTGVSWTRTVYSGHSAFVWAADGSGFAGALNYNSPYGVRPALFLSPGTMIVGGNGGTVYQDVDNTTTDITDLTFDGQVSSVVDAADHTVTSHLPYGTDLSSLAPAIDLSLGASVSPASGVPVDFSSGTVTYQVTALNGTTTQDWTVNCIVDQNAATDFTAFSLSGVEGTINGNAHTVSVNLPYGSEVSNLAATFSLSDGATIKVGAAPQTSEVTSNDFTNPITYTITAQDGVSQQDWTVTCNVIANNSNNFTAYSLAGVDGVVDADEGTVTVTLPYGTAKTNLIASYSLSPGASVKILSPEAVLLAQTSGVSANNFTWSRDYYITAENNTDVKHWTVSVIVQPNTATDITSFSAENEQAVVVTGVVDSSAHTVQMSFPYGSNLMDDYKITCNVSSDATVEYLGQNYGSNFVGWWTMNFNSPVTYTVVAHDGINQQDWTVNSVLNSNTATDITSFSLAGMAGIIDSNAHTVTVNVLHDTIVTDLIASFNLSNGAAAKVNNTSQASGVTGNDFTDSVTYTVTAEDGTTQQDWTVTCVVNSDTSNDITSFSLAGVGGTLDNNAHTVLVNLPHDTDISNLAATFSLSAGASVKVNNTSQTSGVTTNDFTDPVTYTVTAEDGTTQQDWTVTCVITSGTANNITSFSLSGVNGTIDSNAHAILINLPHDVDISNLAASFSLSAGASAKISNTSQTSGVTTNDFTDPVTYTVTAEDDTTQQDWTVTCLNNPPEDPTINPAGGSFDSTVNISITGIDNGCTTYYTTNGASPSLAGTEYTAPFVVEASSTVKAKTYDPNISKWSNIVSETYTIDIPVVQYNVSLSANNQAGGTTGGSGAYAQGNPVTVTANAANGYTFRNWTENGNEVSTAASYSFNMGASNRTLVANFTAITNSGGGGGGGSAPPAPTPPIEEPLLPVEVPEAPVVITGTASTITMSQATLNGQIDSIGGKQCKQVNFAYKQKGTSDWLYTAAASGSFGNGAQFSANLTGLKANAVYDYKARAYNPFGWGEGLVYQFTVVPENLPKVSTEAASNLEVTAAALNGTIIGAGGLPITDSGFLWGTSVNILKKAKATADLDGSLSFILSGLKKNTLYYYRAYATNTAGIGYGDFLSFQTLEKPLLVVTTQTATNIGSDAAVINGSYTGGAGAIIGTAFMLGTGTDTGKYSKISSDITNSDGTFSRVLNGLQPNTTYYYQALASNIYNEFTVLPGDFMSFTTLPPNMPEVETKNPSGITSSGVNLSGIVLKNNGLAVTETGFLWGTDSNPENRVITPMGSDGRNFSYSLLGLKGGTSYNIQAYASNSVGTGYGKVINFNTPARIPSLSTTAADFNADSWQVNFTGNIEDTGGALLTEYGFRYSTDQQKWTPLVIDRGSFTGRIATQINGLNQLPPGIYYVQAYGVNPMGTGYGNTVSFATPVIPKLSAGVEGLGFDSAVLIGNITDTGNKGLPCQNIQFQFRPIGETQWQTVGSEQGLFGPGLFRLNLAGLKPGTKYEVIAQAYNPAGWGSSQVVPFLTGWGLTDKDAAFNMKGAGYNSTDTANVLKRDYRDDDVAAFSALEYATFTVNEIAVGLRDSDYKESRQALVNLLKFANYEVVPVATIIKQIFPETPAPSYFFSNGNVFTIPGKADLTYKWAAECLKNAGYSIDEIVNAMKEVFDYKAIDCVNNLQSSKLAFQPYAIYGAVARAYGINDLANCIWSIESKELQRGSPIYSPLAGVLKALTKGAGITSLQAATLLKEVYPPTNAKQMAGAYKNAGFTALEAGEALMQIFGTDSQALALALVSNDSGPYGLKEIEEFLFTKMNCTAQEMVKIVTIIARNSMVRAYDEVPRVLTDYYKLDAYAAAKAMYAGGWNEANDGTGYGLTNMIRILNDYYGLK